MHLNKHFSHRSFWRSSLVPLMAASLLLLPSAAQAKDSNKTSSYTSRRTTSRSTINVQPRSEAIQAEDEAFLRAQAKDYSAQYARGNAQALASQWAPEGTFTDSTGQQFHGRAEIEKTFAEFFKAKGPQPLVINVESIKFPAPNIAIEVGNSHMTGSDARYTAIHSKESGHWQMVAVFEHEIAPGHAPASISELSWLVGSWTGNADLRVQCDWTASKKFLRLDFFSAKSEGNIPSETEIIGFNPMTQAITSWHFNGNGGIGYGRWSKSGDGWMINARGTESSGASAAAQYSLHKLDDNTYTWKAIKRSAAGKAVADTQETLTLRRSK